MIGYLEGSVLDINQGACVINVQGVGYEVLLPAILAARLATERQKISLHIHTHVREDAITLFGFEDARTKELFRTLLSVSGVGPRTALGIVGVLEPDALCAAILGHDIRRLSSVPGVGRKTAERICLDLREKIQQWQGSASSTVSGALDKPSIRGMDDQLVQILVGLGYKHPEATRASRWAIENAVQPASTETLLRAALGHLA